MNRRTLLASGAAALAWTSQIVFGSDTPYVPIAATATGFDKMTLPDDVRAAIDRGNALQLFPRLA